MFLNLFIFFFFDYFVIFYCMMNYLYCVLFRFDLVWCGWRCCWFLLWGWYNIFLIKLFELRIWFNVCRIGIEYDLEILKVGSICLLFCWFSLCWWRFVDFVVWLFWFFGLWVCYCINDVDVVFVCRWNVVNSWIGMLFEINYLLGC